MVEELNHIHYVYHYTSNDTLFAILERFNTYVDVWTYVSLAATNLDVKVYDLTEEDVKEYIEF
jgi:hypothetical protein